MFGFVLLTSSCDLEKNIQVNLPEYESEIVVESYIEPGQPLRALLTESLSYTELPSPSPLDENTLVTLTDNGQTFSIPLSQLLQQVEGDTAAMNEVNGFIGVIELLGLAKGATVVVKHNGMDYTLEEGIYFDLSSGKIYNYGHPYIVPADYGGIFSIEINASNERNVFASATLLEAVPIDSTVYNFNESDTLAAVLTWFTDNTGTDNYYRFTINKIGESDLSFEVNDRFFDGDDVVFGTAFDYVVGDTLISKLYHIEESYHDFLETFEEAAQANGNPFAQPASILSNVEGGLGIFATISHDEKLVVIE